MNNIKNRLLGCLLVSATISAAVLLPSPTRADAASTTQIQSTSSIGIIQSTVKLRDKPSMTSNVVGYLESGDRVQIMEKSTDYFYKVKTTTGKVGYTSVSDQYIKVSKGNNSVSKPDATTKPPVTTVPSTPNASKAIEDVINVGMGYLGTPYEYGSDRNTTATFDCSDFIRQIYKEGAGITLPADSRQQGVWIQEHSKSVYDTGKLKRGDLVFFMSYKGSSSSAYQGINTLKQTITHVALYLGDNKLLHTYSKVAGGVTVTDFSNSWKLRFMYGGSVNLSK